MAEPIEEPERRGEGAGPEAIAASAGAMPLPAADRALDVDRSIARVLRIGALLSGGLLLASVLLEPLRGRAEVAALIRPLRQVGVWVLVVTPIVRLVVAGVTLGLRGELRYTLYAAGVLVLLALALGAGLVG